MRFADNSADSTAHFDRFLEEILRFSKEFGLEARVGIEPTNAAFAEPCLTTWLPRRRKRFQDS